jgi:inner membrane protein
MDNLTHSLTGLMLSRAGLNSFSPRAPWILLLAANAPDLDAVSGFRGTLSYLDHHRHLTHSLLAWPVMALLPLLIVRVVSRKPLNWWGAYLISLLGVGSHLLLDFTNIYGILLLHPISDRWFRLDATSVIDLWIWAILLLGVAAPALARLVNAEIGSRQKRPGRAMAIFALLALAFYDGSRFVLHERAAAVLDSRIYPQGRTLRVAAFPTVANPFRWHGLVETASAYSLHELNLLGQFDPGEAEVFYKPDPHPAIDRARQTSVFRSFLGFSQYPLWRVIPLSEPENGVRVEAMDMRFGNPLQPGFVATAILDARLEVVRAWFTFAGAGPR